MKRRFEGEEGRRVLVDLLNGQRLVGGNDALAHDIAAVGEVLEVAGDTALISRVLMTTTPT